MDAAYSYNFDTPKYLIMYSESSRNAYGYPRGYRIHSESMTKLLLPKEYRGYRSRAWAEYQVRNRFSLFSYISVKDKQLKMAGSERVW